MIAAPPSLLGFDQVILADESPKSALAITGATGTVAGTSDADGRETGPVPSAFVATTVKMYCCPLVRPVTTQELAPLVAGAVEQVKPPGIEVTVYSVMARPPVLIGADHDTVDLLSSFELATTRSGSDGTPVGVTAADADDAFPAPTQFTATTLKV